jgi:hypothetical protein
MTELSASANSPFDSLKRTDENGDYWLARELFEPLGYVDWRNFQEAIYRARLACSNAGDSPDHHFVDATSLITAGKGAQRSISDVRLLGLPEIGPNGMLALLRNEGVLFDDRCTSGRHPTRHCGGSHPMPYSEHAKAGRIVVKFRAGTGKARKYQYPGLFFSTEGVALVRRKLS